MEENKPETLTLVKEHFGDEVSWDELRLIKIYQYTSD
jgi:hypothetical protein